MLLLLSSEKQKCRCRLRQRPGTFRPRRRYFRSTPNGIALSAKISQRKLEQITNVLYLPSERNTPKYWTITFTATLRLFYLPATSRPNNEATKRNRLSTATSKYSLRPGKFWVKEAILPTLIACFWCFRFLLRESLHSISVV